MHHRTNARLSTLLAAVIAASGTATAHAQIATQLYTLEDVMLLPDVTHPGSPAQPMTGTFEWTYDVDDFENGTGDFLEIDLPWWTEGTVPLAYTVELEQIEITMDGNYHDLGVNVTLRLLEPLSVDQPSTIDPERSAFEIEVGISHMGHIVSGRVIPVQPPCIADWNADTFVNTNDFVAYLNDYVAASNGQPTTYGDPDLAVPFGTINTADFLAYLNLFVAACP